jgi:hypothetical protein
MLDHRTDELLFLALYESEEQRILASIVSQTDSQTKVGNLQIHYCYQYTLDQLLFIKPPEKVVICLQKSETRSMSITLY